MAAPSEDIPSSSSYGAVVPRSVSPQSDLVSLSSTSDGESQYSDAHQSASQDDSDVIEAAANTTPSTEPRGVLVPQVTGSTDDVQSAVSAGQGQSAELPGSSSAVLHSASSSVQSGSGMMQAATSSAQTTVLDSSNLRVSDYESAGLLYARATKARDNIDLLSPADEVGEEVSDAAEAAEDKGNIHLTPAQVRHVSDLTVEHPPLDISERWVAPIDPGALLEMEKSARGIATEMTHVMDNLRNSLYAMTICTKQSMQLHRESIDNLHTAVDSNVKGMYTFMTKFEELHKSLTPMKQLATQIQEMDENLKVLERMFAKTKPHSS